MCVCVGGAFTEHSLRGNPSSHLGLGSRHQQHDARTLIAGERSHGFLSVLDVLAINLKARETHTKGTNALGVTLKSDAPAKARPDVQMTCVQSFSVIQQNKTQ